MRRPRELLHRRTMGSGERANVVRWRVNPHSGVPLYVQIEEQIKTAIVSGVLQEGDRLPTVRELALELTINPNTVVRAYRELERAGFIDTTPGRGTFVKAVQAPPMPEEERRRRLSSVVDVMLTEARALGFADDEIVAAVRSALRGEPGAGAGHEPRGGADDAADGGPGHGANGGPGGGEGAEGGAGRRR